MSSPPLSERRAGALDALPSSYLDDPTLVVVLLSIAPMALGGAVLRAGHGPERDAFLEAMRVGHPAGEPFLKVPFNTADDRLLGGLDLAGTLATGAPVVEPGLLPRAHGGVLTLAMAERWDTPSTLRICMALDRGEVHLERDGISMQLPARFAVIALDEGQADDEHVAPALADRLAFYLPLSAWPPVDVDEVGRTVSDLAAQRARFEQLKLEPDQIRLLVETHAALAVPSLRGLTLAAALARAAAALDGAEAVQSAHLELACRLVLLPRARSIPTGAAEEPPDSADAPENPPEAPDTPEPPPEAPEPPSDTPDEQRDPDMPEEKRADEVLEAALATLPPGLLAMLQGQANRARRVRRADRGRMGERVRGNSQGRSRGAQPGDPRRGGRLAVTATLRAAAPWQRLRSAGTAQEEASRAGDYQRPRIRAEDFHVKRFEHRTVNNILFLVDASGSQAMNRLAEAKGAVESLLADCYARRDRVSLIAFRKQSADLLLPPTRSLVAAKKRLARLPGGGGTPLASALNAAREVAVGLVKRGERVQLVVLTDGRGNVTLDGRGEPAEAHEQALASARALALAGLDILFIDSSPRARPVAFELAEAMQAQYLPLPRALPGGVSKAVRAALVDAA